MFFRHAHQILLPLLVPLITFTAYAAVPHVDQILERLNNANKNRDHVMIGAHRGLWRKEGYPIYAEGSLSSIEKTLQKCDKTSSFYS